MENFMHAATSIFQHPGMIALAALAAMAIEYLATLPDAKETHDLRETASSLTIAAINKTAGYLTVGITALPLLFLYQYRICTIPVDNAVALVAAFVATDFCYYWHHFAMHKIRLLWASHSVHHSPTRLNLTAAVRLGLGGQLAGGFLFYAPLVLIGFHPLVVYAMLGLGLGYQLFIHPAKAPDLGPLEWVLNTPKHHHVHHASNAQCIDKNFGGVFIIFDRMFGTFAEAPEHETLQFGLVGKESTNNLVVILLGEWARIARDVIRAQSLKDIWRSLFSMNPRSPG